VTRPGALIPKCSECVGGVSEDTSEDTVWRFEAGQQSIHHKRLLPLWYIVHIVGMLLGLFMDTR
jgi:hypothetical protein